jgi:hypothetical protein
MKTVVLGNDEAARAIYNPSLVALANHYGYSRGPASRTGPRPKARSSDPTEGGSNRC